MKDKIFDIGALLRWGVKNKFALLVGGLLWGVSDVFLTGVIGFVAISAILKKYKPEDEPETEYIRCPNCDWETLNKEEIQNLIKAEEN